MIEKNQSYIFFAGFGTFSIRGICLFFFCCSGFARNVVSIREQISCFFRQNFRIPPRGTSCAGSTEEVPSPRCPCFVQSTQRRASVRPRARRSTGSGFCLSTDKQVLADDVGSWLSRPDILSRTVAYQSFQIIPRPPPRTEVLMFRRGLLDDSSFFTKMVYKPFAIILSAWSESWMAMFRRGFLGDPSLSTAAACKSLKNTPNYLTQMDDVSSTAHLCPWQLLVNHSKSFSSLHHRVGWRCFLEPASRTHLHPRKFIIDHSKSSPGLHHNVGQGCSIEASSTAHLYHGNCL